MSKHFIQLLELLCLLSVFLLLGFTRCLHQEVWIHDQIISELNIHWLKDFLLPSLSLLCLLSVCLGGNKPNPVCSINSGSFVHMYHSFRNIRNRTDTQDHGEQTDTQCLQECTLWDDALRAGTQRTFVPGSCLKSYILAALHHWSGTAAAKG